MSLGVEEHNIDRICADIEKQAHQSICLNDTNPDVMLTDLDRRIEASFQSILPEPSRFEKG